MGSYYFHGIPTKHLVAIYIAKIQQMRQAHEIHKNLNPSEITHHMVYSKKHTWKYYQVHLKEATQVSIVGFSDLIKL